MTSIEDKIREDLNTARKDKDKPRLLVLSSVLGDLSNARINNGNTDLTEDKAIAVVSKAVKQRQSSALEYEKVGSIDRRDQELNEADLLKVYLPAEATDKDIQNSIKAAIITLGQDEITMRDMGKIIKLVRDDVSANGLLADGGKISKMVKATILNK